MVNKWDNPGPEITAVITEEPAPPTNNKTGAIMFVVWSAFMIAVGFMIGLAINGHIILR